MILNLKQCPTFRKTNKEGGSRLAQAGTLTLSCLMVVPTGPRPEPIELLFLSTDVPWGRAPILPTGKYRSCGTSAQLWVRETSTGLS